MRALSEVREDRWWPYWQKLKIQNVATLTVFYIAIFRKSCIHISYTKITHLRGTPFSRILGMYFSREKPWHQGYIYWEIPPSTPLGVRETSANVIWGRKYEKEGEKQRKMWKKRKTKTKGKFRFKGCKKWRKKMGNQKAKKIAWGVNFCVSWQEELILSCSRRGKGIIFGGEGEKTMVVGTINRPLPVAQTPGPSHPVWKYNRHSASIIT